MIHNYAQMVRAAESAGNQFFSKETLKFWGSKVLKASISPVPDGAYFITSELDAMDEDRRYTIRRISDEGKIETIGDFRYFASANEAKRTMRPFVLTENGKDIEKYRWIMYLHQPHSDFDLVRVRSLEEAKIELEAWSRSVFAYEQASATLYPYSMEDWAEAVEYREIGCPFNYPSKRITFGPRDGLVVENA